MSNVITNYTGLAFTKGLYVGKYDEEVLVINSSGAFVGTFPTSALPVASTSSVGVINVTTQSLAGDKSFIGRMAIGGKTTALNASTSILVVGNGINPLTGLNQFSIRSQMVATTAATTEVTAFRQTSGFGTAVGSQTLALLSVFGSNAITKGAGSTITRAAVLAMTSWNSPGTNNALITDNQTWIGNYGINIAATAANFVGGAFQAGGAITGSNLSGTNTGDNVAASSSATGVVTTGTQSFAGTKTFVTPLLGSNVANASSSAAGVVSTGTQSFAGTKTFKTALLGSNVANASSSAAGVVSTGTQSFAGTKTFVTALTGSNVASASSSASGVVSTGSQSFAGSKTFTTALAGSNVVSASTSATGVVTTSAQSFAGAKIFNGLNTIRRDSSATSFVASATPTILLDNENTTNANYCGIYSTSNNGTNYTAAMRFTASSHTTFIGGLGLYVNTGAGLVQHLSINGVNGVLSFGTGTTAQHIFSGLAGTNGAVAVAITNAPTGVAAAPKEYWQITYNGNTRYIPLLGV